MLPVIMALLGLPVPRVRASITNHLQAVAECYTRGRPPTPDNAVIRILMLGSPPGLSAGDVVAGIEAESGVSGVHHAHLWQMGEHEPALDAHVVIEPGRWGEADAIKDSIKRLLRDRFGVGHSTIELECAAHACDEPQTSGHDREGGN